MTFAAITYPVALGHEEEIADIFSRRNFKRANSPLLRNEAGERVGMIMGTGLFIRDDRMARIIHFQGDIDDVARHMATQDGVQEAERRLAPLLTVPRDTTTVEGFLDYFSRSRMHHIAQSIVTDEPFAGLFATCATIAGSADVDEVDVLVKDIVEQWTSVGAPIVATAGFRHEHTLLRMVQYGEDSTWDDAAAALSADAGAVAGERALAAHLLPAREPAGARGFVEALESGAMRCLSQLSIAGMRFAR